MNETRVKVGNSTEVQIWAATPERFRHPRDGNHHQHGLCTLRSYLAASETHFDKLRPRR